MPIAARRRPSCPAARRSASPSARALVNGPAVIFADEPTGSMDTIGGEHLLELLLGAATDRGAAVVLVTHDNVVAAHAHREVRLRDGRVEAEAVLR